MKTPLIIFLGLHLMSCDSTTHHQSNKLNDHFILNEAKPSDQKQSTDSKVINGRVKIENGIQYQVRLFSAMSFLEKQGSKISASELKELNGESIMVLDFIDIEMNNKILNNKRITLIDEELVSYLELGILSDLTIIQGDKIIVANNVQLESMGSVLQNKIRLLFYFTEVDLSKKYIIQYNDKLFGNGLVRL